MFADSGYAGVETRRSTYGTAIMINGGHISRSSSLGKTIAMSTCEAEIHAAVITVKDAAHIHIKRLLKDLELIQDDRSLEIADDNPAFIAQANSGIRHVRNAKHFEVRPCILQQKVVDKEVEFKYCPADRHIADVFAKPGDDSKFLWFRRPLVSSWVIVSRCVLCPLHRGMLNGGASEHKIRRDKM